MQVVLIKNAKSIGKIGELKEVKRGYALNFLIPKGLAKPATPETLRWLEIQKEIATKKEEENLKGAAELVSKIDGLEVSFTVKTGDKGQLFEKITPQRITEKMREMGFEVKKDQIIMAEPIKEIGEFPVKIKFEHNLEAEIKIIITEEA